MPSGTVTHNARHHFVNGLNLGPAGSGAAKIPVPLFYGATNGWKVYYEDFASGVDVASNETYTLSNTNGTVVPVAGGARFSITGGDNDEIFVQHDTANIIPGAATKRHYLEVSLIFTEVSSGTFADTEIFMGMTGDESTANIIAAGGLSYPFANGFGFGKLDLETALSFVIGKDNTAETAVTQQITSLGTTLTSGTRHVLGAYYDGGSYTFYKDGAEVAKVVATSTAVNTANATMMTFKFKVGAASSANTWDVHYMAYAQEL